jgi:membrane protein implicated in regulation of membrane protease activity
MLAYTFGQLLAIATAGAFIVAWAVAAVSVFRRGDLGLPAKALWTAFMLVVPIIGLLAYYLWQAANPDRTR